MMAKAPKVRASDAEKAFALDHAHELELWRYYYSDANKVTLITRLLRQYGWTVEPPAGAQPGQEAS